MNLPRPSTAFHAAGADLGGFHGTTDENYVRWLQWGAFSPIFRTHGSSDNEKRIWKFGTYELLADAMRLRGAMVRWRHSLAFHDLP